MTYPRYLAYSFIRPMQVTPISDMLSKTPVYDLSMLLETPYPLSCSPHRSLWYSYTSIPYPCYSIPNHLLKKDRDISSVSCSS